MATVTGYTAQRMKQIEDKAIVDGNVVGDNLILVAKDGTTQDAGSVRGPQGVQGVPGEVTLAQLNAKTGVSAQAGQDLLLGSDGKPYFDHDTKYVDHNPHFADTAARNAAIPSPVGGQLATVAGIISQYSTARSAWLPVTAVPRKIATTKTNGTWYTPAGYVIGNIVLDVIGTYIVGAEVDGNAAAQTGYGFIEMWFDAKVTTDGGFISQLFSGVKFEEELQQTRFGAAASWVVQIKNAGTYNIIGHTYSTRNIAVNSCSVNATQIA